MEDNNSHKRYLILVVDDEIRISRIKIDDEFIGEISIVKDMNDAEFFAKWIVKMLKVMTDDIKR